MSKEIDAPEVEKELEKDETKDVTIPPEEFNAEMELCKRNPHKYIMDWMEGNLLFVGSKVMRLLALQPGSLILPNIPFMSSAIKTPFNILIIAPPSGGKSSISKKYLQITYHPYEIRKVSEPQLVDDLYSKEIFTLVLEDFSQIGNDYEVIKVIEGALGDEQKVMKRNKRQVLEKNVVGVGLICGTWSDLSRYLEYFKAGFLFRNNIMFIDLTGEQKRKIGKYINDGIGNKTGIESSLKKQFVVKKYYDKLYNLMSEGKTQVKDYHLDKKLKDEL